MYTNYKINLIQFIKTLLFLLTTCCTSWGLDAIQEKRDYIIKVIWYAFQELYQQDWSLAWHTLWNALAYESPSCEQTLVDGTVGWPLQLFAWCPKYENVIPHCPAPQKAQTWCWTQCMCVHHKWKYPLAMNLSSAAMAKTELSSCWTYIHTQKRTVNCHKTVFLTPSQWSTMLCVIGQPVSKLNFWCWPEVECSSTLETHIYSGNGPKLIQPPV